MAKLDLKKEYKELFNPSKKDVSVVDVPSFNYLMVQGAGRPDGDAATEAISALYPVAYGIKFMKKAEDKDFGVPPLEGLWWADDMEAFKEGKKDKWKWIYMIMMPGFVTKKDVNDAIKTAKEKKPELTGLDKVTFEKLKEGKSAQIMHIGPYAEEDENIQKIHDHIKEIGGKFDGKKQKHHEIYLSDPRRAAPEKMKTIIRQPFV